MKKETIEKWVIGKKSSSGSPKFAPKLVYADLEDYNSNKTMVKCCYAFTNRECEIRKEWLYDYEEAVTRCKEFEIKVNFKNKKRNKDGTWRCSCCKKIITDEQEATVDHIKPKAYFKDKETGKYYSEEHWEKCWSEDNLDITCTNCNMSKGNLPKHRHNNINKKANKHKKYLRYTRGKLKNKPAYKVSSKDEDAFAIARRDSNYIDVDAFFKKNKRRSKNEQR